MSKKEEEFLRKQLEEQNSIFADVSVVSCYTWEDAIEDGIFVGITDTAKRCGYTIPVAITCNVFSKIKGETKEETNKNISLLLEVARNKIIENSPKNDKQMSFQYEINGEIKELWASIEGRKPSNPEPVMTILFPEDY